MSDSRSLRFFWSIFQKKLRNKHFPLFIYFSKVGHKKKKNNKVGQKITPKKIKILLNRKKVEIMFGIDNKQPCYSIFRELQIVGEDNGTPLQYSCLENPMDGGAWQAAVHGVAKSRARLSDFTFPFHFHALEKEMATHSSVLAWRIPGMGESGGLPSMGSHRVGYD